MAQGLLVQAEAIIARAKAGENIPVAERRHAVAFIIATQPEMSNMDMARLFGVDDKSIRNDLKLIKHEKAEDVRDSTDVKLIISDLLAARDRALSRVNKAIKALEALDNGSGLKLASPSGLALIKAELDIHLKVTEALQNMGWLPKNIGQLTVNKKVWKAIVEHKTGGIREVRPVDLFDDIRDGETLEEALRRKSNEQRQEIQDGEFIDLPQLVPLLPVKSEEGKHIEESAKAADVSDRPNNA